MRTRRYSGGADVAAACGQLALRARPARSSSRRISISAASGSRLLGSRCRGLLGAIVQGRHETNAHSRIGRDSCSSRAESRHGGSVTGRLWGGERWQDPGRWERQLGLGQSGGGARRVWTRVRPRRGRRREGGGASGRKLRLQRAPLESPPPPHSSISSPARPAILAPMEDVPMPFSAALPDGRRRPLPHRVRQRRGALAWVSQCA